MIDSGAIAPDPNNVGVVRYLRLALAGARWKGVPFEGDGDSVVDKPRYKAGKVWINATQGFANVSLIAWAFHIGGYQPRAKMAEGSQAPSLVL